ncbi:MAG TPA: hypothetical protein VII50_00465 [Acidothermaceae bacterium]
MVDKQGHEHQVQTAIRIPESWVDRLDKLAKIMSAPGVPATRAGALRSALYRGIVEMEKEKKR